MKKFEEQSGYIDKIEADFIVVEVTDKNTGRLFRRTLPVVYLETDNGLILSGETADGCPAQIVFLSGSALKKINDVTGNGPDSPVCG